MSRSNTLLLILGILLGFGGGLAYSWLISPVEYTDTAPASLRQDFKEDHLSLISLAYSATGDLNRTRARLALLGISASPEEISRLAQSRLAAGRPESEADALAQLAAVLGQRPAPLSGTVTPTSTGLSLAPTATATIAPSPTTRPSPTASPTPGAPFAFVEQEPICDPRLSEPLIQVLVQDAAGEGVAGIEILVVWDEGQDRFFTGLKPELGAGYADFTMSPDTAYSLQLVDGEGPVTGLSTETCTTDTGEPYLGSLQLIFQQPALD